MSITPTQAAMEATKRLGGVWHGRSGKAKCPAHDDRSPSLSITPGRKVVLFHCFAGCTQDAIMRAVSSRAPYQRPTDYTETVQSPRDLTPLARSLFERASPLKNSPAALYLESRKIAHSTVGRYDPAALTYEAGKRVRLPALFLPITLRNQLIALNRIFIDETGAKHPRLDEPKRTLGDPRGGAVKIGRIEADHLNLAEGFEDAESVIAMHNLPGCWSVNGTENYSHLSVPDHIQSITIYSQHGEGAAAGIDRAEANLYARGRSVSVILPPPGGDWNDAWRAEA